MEQADFTPFGTLALIGVGLIGSSIARAARTYGLAHKIICADHSADVCARVQALGFADVVTSNMAEAVRDADLIILCVPVGAMDAVGAAIGPHIKAGAIVSDVGSVKMHVVQVLAPHIPATAHFIPAHPIAGTEHSGPEAGFDTLFKGRWCIATPQAGADGDAVKRLSDFWAGMGSMVVSMEAGHHDRTLAITSHVPHLIAYTIVGTATDLEGDLQSEVIKFSASGFRDFTRIAASDPVMWRDVFLTNKDAVLEILQRFTEDLTALQKAIRRGDGATLQDTFTRTRAIRRKIIEAKQAS